MEKEKENSVPVDFVQITNHFNQILGVYLKCMRLINSHMYIDNDNYKIVHLLVMIEYCKNANNLSFGCCISTFLFSWLAIFIYFVLRSNFTSLYFFQ